MLKKLPQDQLEDESIAAISTICRALNWDFNVQVKDKSGIDAEIEFVNGIVRTGLFLRCQLKAGMSYISSETEEALRIRVESKYLQHWYQSNVQIALLFYHPIDKAVFWKDIRDYLRVHLNLLAGTQETRIVEFHKKLDLLTTEALPILEQVARGDFHYGFISLQEDVSELAFSNRFPALPFPGIWVAPTPCERKSDVTERIEKQYAFAIHGGQMYSLADLRKPQCELGRFCDKSRAVPRVVRDVPEEVLTEMLNVCRDLTLYARGLESRRDKFFFPLSLLRHPSTNKFAYTSLQGKPEQRTLICIQKEEEKLERKHHAVRLSFDYEDGKAFLQIDPDWHFTFPEKMTPLERKARLIGEKAGLHNKEILYLLHFWRQYLSQNTDRIALSVSSNPLFGNVEFSSSPIEYILPFRLVNDYFGPKRQDSPEA